MPSDGKLTPELASAFARIALGHVAREYPNKLDQVLNGPGDLRGPRDLHPIFFGSFDWHSCVHGYWTLATLLRRHPDMPEASAIHALFDNAFTAIQVEGEASYLREPSARGFERPYGWGWLLKLQAELLSHGGRPWAARLQPLAAVFVQRFDDYLPRASYAGRNGSHANTAFSFAMASDYAVATDDADFRDRLAAKAAGWYLADRDAPAWEPSGDDFLSATLIEAECLRRLLPAEQFRGWFDDFLPRIAQQQPAALFTPTGVSDRTDGKIVHLDGLNLSRAWCWRELAGALDPADPRRTVMQTAADRHLAASLPHVAGDYMGGHWLASFALLALTAGGR